MPEVYDVAALRHYRDGEVLRESRRIANADQLFGFAAECAIKSALVSLPGRTDRSALAGSHHKHVDQLWDRVRLQSIQRRCPRLVAVLRGLPQVFADWSTDQRYGPDEAVADEAMERHRRAAARALGSVGLSGARREA